MMRQSKFIWLVLLLFAAMCTSAQDEVLGDLGRNPYINRAYSTGGRSSTLLYQLDTLQLPFYEDFSRNRQKRYDAQEGDSNLTEVSWVHYLYNNSYVDTIRLAFSPTYSYDYNFQNQQYDSFPNAQVQVDIFSPVFPFGLDTGFLAWPAQSLYYLGDMIKTVNLAADCMLYNIRDTFLVVPDDAYSYWVDNDVYINNNYGKDPPTIGVATFDGLDSTGYPYNFGMSQGSNGSADVLTTKPFNLDQSMSNVYLSFFYQPQGYGNAPEAKDSLVLEFYAPAENKWYWQWSAAGESVKDFSEVYIPVTSSSFLQAGFRFRFRNYATLSGALDHWNLDYIRLDENRTTSDEIDDVAFREELPSFLSAYTAMPWDHYSASQMASVMNEGMNNLSNSAKFVVNTFFVYDQGNTLLYTSAPVTNGSATAGSPFTMSHVLSYSFPPMTSKDKFIIAHTTNTTPDANRDNDTIVRNQVFDTYYAYDDGSAEQGYALVGAGAKLAYRYSLTQTDTLTGILMYFPPMLENVSLRSFRLTVWDDNSGTPGNIIYQSSLYNPMYTSGTNTFYYYPIDDTELLVSGIFYIGWEQIASDKIYLGFDVNIDNSDKIFYNTSGIWNSTSFYGSLMLRPAFGVSEEFPIYIPKLENAVQDIAVFPNPASDAFTVTFDGKIVQLSIYGLQGDLLLQTSVTPGQSISLTDLSPGMYFAEFSNDRGVRDVIKIVISR